MLENVLRYLRNWFVVPGGIRCGIYTIENGSIHLPFLQEKQYFRIVGSVFNDGVYQYPVYNLSDETFDGAIWAMAVPQALLDTVRDIEAWNEKNAATVESPYVSESFGGYSYTKAGTGVSNGWKDAFRSRLNQWRKI